MANRTDVTAIKAFGSNPQYLISNIIRSKIYENQYWKEKCFALTSESIIDQAINLKYVGGTYGGNRKSTRFICLVLKLLQIQPDKDIVYEFIKNEDFIYLRALGIFYLRLVGKSLEIYQNLEPILFDYRKIRMRLPNGTFQKIYMDDFVDNCLVLSNFLDVDFPTLTKRQILEENNLLEPRNLEYYKELLNISSDNEVFQNANDKAKKNIQKFINEKSDLKCYDMVNNNHADGENGNEESKNNSEERVIEREVRRKHKVKKDKLKKIIREKSRSGNRRRVRKRDEGRNKERSGDRGRGRGRNKNLSISNSVDSDRGRENKTRRKKKKRRTHDYRKKKRYSSKSQSIYSSSDSNNRHKYKDDYEKK